MGQPIDTAEVEIVPDFGDFARQLKAGIDQALRGVQTAVTQAFARVEDAAGRAGTDVGQEFQRGGERAEAAFGEVSRTARKEFAEVEAAAAATSSGMSGKFGGALGIIKTGLLGIGIAAGAGLAAVTAFGLKSAADLEQTTVGMTALTGSTETALAFLGELQTFAASTPFEFAGVADASRRILAFGQSVGIARNEVIPTLTTIGDLVSVLGGTQESVDSVVRALSQMASKGKLSQEEIMQLAEALPGFNANAAIAAQLGLSVGDTLELISAGGVDATTGINALLSGMAQFPGAAGAMAAQAQTLSGVFSTFKDTASIALTNAFQPVIPEIKSALADLTPILGSAIGQLAPSLGGALSAILPIVGKLITAIVPILTPLLDALGPVLDAIGPALIPLGEALGQLIVALAPVLPVLAQFIAVLALLAIPIIKLLAAVLIPLTPVLNYMALAIGEVARALGMINWTEVGEAISGAFAKAWHAVSDFVVGVAKAIFGFGEMLGTKLREFIANIALFVANLVLWVQSIPDRILEALGNFGNLLYSKGRDLIVGLWNGIKDMGSWLWGKITGFVGSYVTGPIKAALGIASPSTVMRDEVGKMLPAGIEEGVRAGIPSLAGLIGGIVPSGAGGAGGGGAGAMAFGGITINLVFNGGVPSEGEARSLGSAAGDALMARITAQRNIMLAGRTA
jgi:tape measure domain-containing protein